MTLSYCFGIFAVRRPQFTVAIQSTGLQNAFLNHDVITDDDLWPRYWRGSRLVSLWIVTSKIWSAFLPFLWYGYRNTDNTRFFTNTKASYNYLGSTLGWQKLVLCTVSTYMYPSLPTSGPIRRLIVVPFNVQIGLYSWLTELLLAMWKGTWGNHKHKWSIEKGNGFRID